MKRCFTTIAPACLLAAAIPAFAQQTTWTGATNSDTNNGGNWSDGGPGFQDDAIFDNSATVPNQPIANNDTTEVNLMFNTAGWTFGTDGDSLWGLLGLDSAGAGVNEIAVDTFDRGNYTRNITAGNTVLMSGAIQQSGLMGFDGGGTYIVTGTNGSANNFNHRIDVVNGTSAWFTTGLFLGGNMNIANGVIDATSTLGINGTLTGYQYQTVQIGNGTLAIGGDGTYAPAIGTLEIVSGNGANYTNVVMNANSTLSMDIGATLGSNDVIDLNTTGGGLNLGDATLALSGPLAPEDGAYRIVTVSGTSG